MGGGERDEPERIDRQAKSTVEIMSPELILVNAPGSAYLKLLTPQAQWLSLIFSLQVPWQMFLIIEDYHKLGVDFLDCH